MMKNRTLKVTLGIALVAGLIQACASTRSCYNDACYDRKAASVDAYEEGDIAAWGTEKQQAEKERREEHRSGRQDRKPASN
ncbi:MAG: hypothetical protein HUU37_02965 [Bdellovibrionales bacterium]|nr:hypothetical protein [Bdellovibrionales bacterium]